MFRGICVDIAPPSLRDDAVPAGVRVESLRPLSPSTPGDYAPWLDGLPDRPAVYATLGTVFNDLAVVGVCSTASRASTAT